MNEKHYDPEKVTQFFSFKGKYGSEPYFDGENLRVCCPFPHTDPISGKTKFEKIPSFGVNLFNGNWNCFSCGAKGRNLQTLAKRLGKEVPLMFRTKERATRKLRDAKSIYTVETLAMNPDKAVEYIVSRGLHPKLAEVYSLGFDEVNRKLLIPIRDREGELLAWMERNLEVIGGLKATIQPEYVDKTKLIFGLYENRKPGKVFLVESPFDAMKINTFGYPAVATLGASFSKNAVEELLDNYDHFVLVPQNDAAGLNWITSFKKRMEGRTTAEIVYIPNKYKDVGEMSSAEEFKEFYKKRKFINASIKNKRFTQTKV